MITAAAGDREHVTLVAQSMGAFSAPMARSRRRADHPRRPDDPRPGRDTRPVVDHVGAARRRRAAVRIEWETFFHDVPENVCREARERGEPKAGGKAVRGTRGRLAGLARRPDPRDRGPGTTASFPTLSQVQRLAKERSASRPSLRIATGHMPGGSSIPRCSVRWPMMATRRLAELAEKKLRLMVRGRAAVGHEHGIRQPDICAARLHVSQARVSRLLQQVRAERVSSAPPSYVTRGRARPRSKKWLEERYGLRERSSSSCFDDTRRASTLRHLCNATARFLEASLTGGYVVGILSWSRRCWARCGRDAARSRPGPVPSARCSFRRRRQPAAEAHARASPAFRGPYRRTPHLPARPGIASSCPRARGADQRPLRPGGARVGLVRRRRSRSSDRRARALQPAARGAATSSPSRSWRRSGLRARSATSACASSMPAANAWSPTWTGA